MTVAKDAVDRVVKASKRFIRENQDQSPDACGTNMVNEISPRGGGQEGPPQRAQLLPGQEGPSRWAQPESQLTPEQNKHSRRRVFLSCEKQFVQEGADRDWLLTEDQIGMPPYQGEPDPSPGTIYWIVLAWSRLMPSSGASQQLFRLWSHRPSTGRSCWATRSWWS